MTYPPQQPPPYGQDPYGQQQPYGQDPYGQQPQQPYGGQYGQTPWSGQQPGYPVGPPPGKKRGGLIASLIIVAILVVGGGGVGLYFLLSNDKKENSADGGGGGDQDSPKATADAYVKALEKIVNDDPQDVDVKPLKPLACADDFDKLKDVLDFAEENAPTTGSQPPRPKVDLGIKDFKETKSGATFTLTVEEDGEDNDNPEKMDVTKKGDAWQVCGLFGEGGDDEGGGGGGGGGPTTSRPIPNPIPTT